jgi:hypothetical protein
MDSSFFFGTPCIKIIVLFLEKERSPQVGFQKRRFKMSA